MMIMNPNTAQSGRKAKNARLNRTRRKVVKRKRGRRMAVVKKVILRKLKRKLSIPILQLLAAKKVVDEKRLKKRKHRHPLIQVSTQSNNTTLVSISLTNRRSTT